MESHLSSEKNINKTDFSESEKFQKSDSTELVSVSFNFLYHISHFPQLSKTKLEKGKFEQVSHEDFHSNTFKIAQLRKVRYGTNFLVCF